MTFTDTQVAGKFAAFEQERNPGLVHEALEMVEAAQRELAGDAAGARQVLSSWLRFLAALEGIIDPRWDPKDLPGGVPAPPSQGKVYPSGDVDPVDIPDPVARAQYEAALKASHDYRQWYSTQFQLRRIEERAMLLIGVLLAARFTDSQQDRQELEKLIAESPVNDLRKERLRALRTC